MPRILIVTPSSELCVTTTWLLLITRSQKYESNVISSGMMFIPKLMVIIADGHTGMMIP